MRKRFLSHPFLIGLSWLILSSAGGALGALAAGGFTLPVSRATGGGQILTGGAYQLTGAAGQPDAGQLVGGSLRVNGGVIPEMTAGEPIPASPWRLYLPINLRIYPTPGMHETEPNDLFSQANAVPSLPMRVFGTHDGEVGGGDVFCLSLDAGLEVEVTLSTGNVSGVQLLAYDAAGTEITRDYAAPFDLSFSTPYNGAYYVYVFSAPEASNSASYTLTLGAESSIPGFSAEPAPVMDAARLGQPPAVRPTP